jgi:hypothetical protein
MRADALSDGHFPLRDTQAQDTSDFNVWRRSQFPGTWPQFAALCFYRWNASWIRTTMQRSRPSPFSIPERQQRDAALDRSVQLKIGRMLKESYSELASEPVPERLIKLMEALDKGLAVEGHVWPRSSAQ